MTVNEEIAHGESGALEFKEARPKDSLKYLKTVVAFANGCYLAHGVISAEASIHWPKGHRRKAAARVVPSLRSKWLQR